MPEILENPPIFDQLQRFRPPHWSLNKWAVEAGVSRTVWADIRKHGNPTRRTLEKLLEVAGSSLAEFEALRSDVMVKSEVAEGDVGLKDVERAWRGLPRARPVPHLGSAYGGEIQDEVEMTELHLAEVLDYLPRPPSLANDDKAYSLTIVGDSMAPRFEPGERVYVSPRATVGIGDDVIVQLKGTGEEDDADKVTMVLIKRIVRRTARHVELKQFNPDVTFTVPVERIAAVHRVLGRL